MTREEAILYLEHTSGDDFNLEEHQIQNRLNAIQFLLEENQKLKKQLKNYKKLGFKHLQDKNNNLETQQKKFINYLEDLIKQNETVVEVSKYGLPKNCSKLLIDFYKEVLQNYREIVGGDR